MDQRGTGFMHSIKKTGILFGLPLLAPRPKTVLLPHWFLKTWKMAEGFFTVVLAAVMWSVWMPEPDNLFGVLKCLTVE